MLCGANSANFVLPKLQHQRVHLIDGLVIADSCALMLTVKGMFTLSSTEGTWPSLQMHQGVCCRQVEESSRGYIIAGNAAQGVQPGET